MLSPNELSNLYKIISDENQTFESIAKLFNETFQESDQFKIAITISILIKDNLLNITQRIISYYLLYIMKQNFNFQISPFIPIILESILKSNHINEQSFIFDFLNNKINYINSSIKAYIQENTNKFNSNNQILPYLQMIRHKYQLEKNLIGINNQKMNNYIRYILYDRKKGDIKNIDNHQNINLEKNINIEKELTINYYEPSLMSFCSGINNKRFIENEPIWIMPQLRHNYIWENEGESNDKKEKGDDNIEEDDK